MLTTLKNKFTPVNDCGWEIKSVEKDVELSSEVKQLSSDFPNVERNGRIKNHQVKFNLKPDAKITQQKGRRIPIQLQNAVDTEIK